MTSFRVLIEINLAFLWVGMKNLQVIRVGIEIDLTSVLGSKFT